MNLKSSKEEGVAGRVWYAGREEVSPNKTNKNKG